MTHIASQGATMAVDWEQRIDFARLRSDRFERAQAALRDSDLGALLLFDPNNIRYVTSTHIGEWARDKNARFVFLPREGDPILWDFGSAARHHQLYAPWFPDDSWRAGVTSMRGAMPRETGVPDTLAGRIADEMRQRGVEDEQLGIDVTDLVTLEALQRHGIATTDAQRVMLLARKIKTAEELALLDHAAAIVDAVYEDIYRRLRPGVTENELVAEAMKILFELGSEQVEAINAVSGDRCNPHPHVFSDRLLRPGDQAFFDIIQSFMGYRTCYYRTFNVGGVNSAQLDAYKQCREWLDAAIQLVRPGMTTDKIAEVWPTAEETYCAATDGRSAARIEEEVVVTASGCDVITRFPAEELLVAGRMYVRGADLVREGGESRHDGAPDLAAAVASSAAVEPAAVPR